MLISQLSRVMQNWICNITTRPFKLKKYLMVKSMQTRRQQPPRSIQNGFPLQSTKARRLKLWLLKKWMKSTAGSNRTFKKTFSLLPHGLRTERNVTRFLRQLLKAIKCLVGSLRSQWLVKLFALRCRPWTGWRSGNYASSGSQQLRPSFQTLQHLVWPTTMAPLARPGRNVTTTNSLMFRGLSISVRLM